MITIFFHVSNFVPRLKKIIPNIIFPVKGGRGGGGSMDVLSRSSENLTGKKIMPTQYLLYAA